MRLKQLELTGFKSFAKKTTFVFDAPITAIVGPNGSGKSNCAEAFRWVLGERSMKSLRGTRGEDLIFNGAGTIARMNRAAVTLTFDNRDRKFNVDFDEIAISREVHRDGTNVYLINGSAVRHRDIIELLANVSLGSSDHYIVSQGDADRILNAGSRERRSMIEDALGLRIYQWKIEESEKKLEKTEENIGQVESLRRELAPHLKFLKKQVEKVEAASKMRVELKQAYFEYLTREEKYLQAERASLETERRGPDRELAEIRTRLASKSQAADSGRSQAHEEERRQIESEARQLVGKKDELSRRLGRLEGVIDVKEAAVKAAAEAQIRDFAADEVRQFTATLENELSQAEAMSDILSVRGVLSRLRQLVKHFLERGHSGAGNQDLEAELNSFRQEKNNLEQELARLVDEEVNLNERRQAVARAVEEGQVAAREAERETYELKARVREIEAALSAFALREDKLRIEEENFKRELDEGVVLVDQEILRFRDFAPSSLTSENREKQEERRRQIERLKIRLEDMGLESGDVLKEFKETTERDEFLAKEIADLHQSKISLEQVIRELREKIDHDFKEGITKINRQFQDFFALMFGGGTAGLNLVKEKSRMQQMVEEDEQLEGLSAVALAEEEDLKMGIEISVNLPRKKIRGLDMLSGGERALTSIALLFAMSQVNPPPFLILDETDAALDESNSRKYGEMVENLSKHSQLILITHNRETMSRAGVLYGVTMGSDGMSKLLSIKFDQAAAFAK